MICPVCQSANTSLLLIKNSVHIQRCHFCDTGFQIEHPPQTEDFYQSQYYSERERGQGQFINWVQQDEIRRRLDLIERYAAKGTLLDIGCGYGYFLHYAKKRGYQVAGIEPNEYSIDRAKHMFGIDVTKGLFDGNAFTNVNFGVITAFHVIEHVPDPVAFVRQIRRRLPPNGIVVLETPNLNSRNSRRMKERWPFILPHEHLFYFSRSGLIRLLEKEGFRVEYTKLTGPFIHQKSASLKSQSTGTTASLKFKLMKRLYYFASEHGRLGDHVFIIARKIQ